jgi:DNA processing protein
MDEQASSLHWLILARAPGLHTGTLATLLARFESLGDALAAKPAELIALGLTANAAQRLSQPDLRAVEADLRWLEQANRAFVSCQSPLYPPLLKQLPDAPIGLFVQGEVGLLALPQLAIVGSRNPTALGRETAHAFAAHLSNCGLTITSGLAIGIDAASHEGALRANGNTIAVCGTGLATVYPRVNEPLAVAISERGALVSQFPPDTTPAKYLFALRNRIISGMSLGTLVVEAALHSGSLITARHAAEQGREVFAIPGSIHNTLAKGCHQLIRQGAKLVESADDILSELGPLVATLRPAIHHAIRSSRAAQSQETTENTRISSNSLDKDYKILLDALGFNPAGVDQLVALTGRKAAEIASMLLILELEGHIESQPGGLFSRAKSGT